MIKDHLENQRDAANICADNGIECAPASEALREEIVRRTEELKKLVDRCRPKLWDAMGFRPVNVYEFHSELRHIVLDRKPK